MDAGGTGVGVLVGVAVLVGVTVGVLVGVGVAVRVFVGVGVQSLGFLDVAVPVGSPGTGGRLTHEARLVTTLASTSMFVPAA